MNRILTICCVLFAINAFGQSSVNITFKPNVAGSGADGTAPDTSTTFVVAKSDDYYLAGLILNQSFADSITFLVSSDGSNWFKLTKSHPDSSTDYVIEADSSKASLKPLDPDVFAALSRFRMITDVAVSTDSVQVGILGLRSRRSFF